MLSGIVVKVHRHHHIEVVITANGPNDHGALPMCHFKGDLCGRDD